MCNYNTRCLQILPPKPKMGINELGCRDREIGSARAQKLNLDQNIKTECPIN